MKEELQWPISCPTCESTTQMTAPSPPCSHPEGLYPPCFLFPHVPPHRVLLHEEGLCLPREGCGAVWTVPPAFRLYLLPSPSHRPGSEARAAWFPGPGLSAAGTQARDPNRLLGSQEHLAFEEPSSFELCSLVEHGKARTSLLVSGQEECVRLSGRAVGAPGRSPGQGSKRVTLSPKGSLIHPQALGRWGLGAWSGTGWEAGFQNYPSSSLVCVGFTALLRCPLHLKVSRSQCQQWRPDRK